MITGSVDFAPQVIVDRELIAGQNPRSDHPIAAKLIEALADCLTSAAELRYSPKGGNDEEGLDYRSWDWLWA